MSPNKRKLYIKERIIIVMIVAIALIVSNIWAPRINSALGLTTQVESVNSIVSNNISNNNLTIGGKLDIHFADVGQGDCAIIELPDNKKMIVDSGDADPNTTSKLMNYIANNIKDSTGSHITHFDYALLTHSDADHCGGFSTVLATYPATIFYRPNIRATKDGYIDPATSLPASASDEFKLNYGYIDTDTLAYENAIKQIYTGHAGVSGLGSQQVIVTDANDSRQNVIKPNLPTTDADYYEIDFYSPTLSTYGDTNDYSPIIIINYQGKHIVMSGDAGSVVEETFASNAKSKWSSIFTSNYSVDIMKLGHHGSTTSSCLDYLNTLTTAQSRPNVKVVISCGLNNSYHLPSSATLKRLKDDGFRDTNVLRTDQLGNIEFSIREDINTSSSTYGQYVIYQGNQQIRSIIVAKSLSWKQFCIIAWALFVILMILQIVLQNNRYRKISITNIDE